jgi:hypothetical protein
MVSFVCGFVIKTAGTNQRIIERIALTSWSMHGICEQQNSRTLQTKVSQIIATCYTCYKMCHWAILMHLGNKI